MRLPPRIAKLMPQHTRRERPDMSPSHLANVRKLPCLSCGADHGCDANHIMHPDHGRNSRGLSRTSADKWTIPACRPCHHAVTDAADDDAWYIERGIDARAVAMALWASREDLEAMRRVVIRARQDAALRVRRTMA